MKFVTPKPQKVREFEIIGHLLQVFPLGGGRWEVLVDGEEVSSSCTSIYAAWAVGAAESYHRGRKPKGAPPGERS